MTTRQDFLDAIRKTPRDNLLRMVYADWLQENAEDDIDRATEEFIRISCDRPWQQLMPKPAYAWLQEGWRRLVPAVAELTQSSIRYGGWIRAKCRNPPDQPLPFQIEFKWSYGLIRKIRFLFLLTHHPHPRNSQALRSWISTAAPAKLRPGRIIVQV